MSHFCSQEHVVKEDLLSALYCEFINRVNEVGVDVNKAIAHPHTQSLVQYVCGLGPRKGSHLLKVHNTSASVALPPPSTAPLNAFCLHRFSSRTTHGWKTEPSWSPCVTWGPRFSSTVPASLRLTQPRLVTGEFPLWVL